MQCCSLVNPRKLLSSVWLSLFEVGLRSNKEQTVFVCFFVCLVLVLKRKPANSIIWIKDDKTPVHIVS